MKISLAHLSVMLQESRLRSRRVVRCCKLCTHESVMLVYAKSS